MTSPKLYVVGFMFDPARTHVVLIRKNRPERQVGKVNGVGGKIEPGETPDLAMAREFREETGMSTEPSEWRHMVTIEWDNANIVRVGDREPAVVTFFRCFSSESRLVQSHTDEEVFLRPIDEIASSTDLMPNLYWLLPLALYTADTFEPFVMKANVAGSVA